MAYAEEHLQVRKQLGELKPLTSTQKLNLMQRIDGLIKRLDGAEGWTEISLILEYMEDYIVHARSQYEENKQEKIMLEDKEMRLRRLAETEGDDF